MEPNPELSETTGIFTAQDLVLCCELVLKPTLCEDYLTLMNAQLRKHRYQHKLNPRSALMIEGLRHEYGVDIQPNVTKAYECYELAEKQYSIIASSKLISRELAGKQQRSLDDMAYRWMLSGCIVFDDTRIDFWDDLLKHQPKLVDKLKKLLQKRLKDYPNDLDVQFMALFFESKNKRTEEDITPALEKLRGLAVVHEHMPAAHYLLYILYYARLSNQLTQFTLCCEEYIDLLRKHRYYHAFADCAKTLNKLKRHDDTMQMLREGTRAGYEVCMSWLLCGIYSYEYKQLASLSEVMDIYTQICLHQDTYWYEYLYSRMLAKKGYFKHVPTSASDGYYAELERQFVKIVVEHNQNTAQAGKLQDEFGLIIHYYLPEMPLEVKDELLTDMVNKSFKEDRNQRLYLCFLMKTRRRMYKEALKTEDQTAVDFRKSQLRQTENQFIEFCKARSNNSDSSTAFFRLGRCYQRGYGVTADLVQACILYCKSLQQITLKHEVSFNTSVTIYHCRERCRRKLQQMAEHPEFLAFEKQVRRRIEEDGCCGVCLQCSYDAILYPCQHLTCTSCYSKYKEINEVCPLCRTKIMACLSTKWILELTHKLSLV